MVLVRNHFARILAAAITLGMGAIFSEEASARIEFSPGSPSCVTFRDGYVASSAAAYITTGNGSIRLRIQRLSAGSWTTIYDKKDTTPTSSNFYGVDISFSGSVNARYRAIADYIDNGNSTSAYVRIDCG